MTLKEKIMEYKKEAVQRIPAEAMSMMQAATQQLKDSGIMNNVLKNGESMPSFELTNSRGELIGSSDLLKKGPLVILFYRGVW